MRKIKTLIIVSLLAISMVGCGNSTADKAIEQGKLAMASKEYDKALASFKLAIDEGSKDKSIKIMYSIIETYNNAYDKFEEDNIEEAKKIIDEINNEYVEYSIKDDVDSLKVKIDEKVKIQDEINDYIEQIKKLVKNKDYNDAKSLIEEVNKKELSEKNKEEIDELNNRIESELSIIEAEKKAKEQEQNKKQQFTKQKAISYVMNIYGVAEEMHDYRVPFEMKNDGKNYYEVYYDYVGSSIPVTYYEYKVYENGEVIKTLDNLN